MEVYWKILLSSRKGKNCNNTSHNIGHDIKNIRLNSITIKWIYYFLRNRILIHIGSVWHVSLICQWTCATINGSYNMVYYWILSYLQMVQPCTVGILCKKITRLSYLKGPVCDLFLFKLLFRCYIALTLRLKWRNSRHIYATIVASSGDRFVYCECPSNFKFH